jgi:hypothetical protein
MGARNVSILGETRSTHRILMGKHPVITTYFSNINLNVTLSDPSRLSKQPFSKRFPHQIPYASLALHPHNLDRCPHNCSILDFTILTLLSGLYKSRSPWLCISLNCSLTSHFLGKIFS